MFQIPTIRQAPSLRPLTTAHLAQTMALLEMTAVELNQKIESELASNPALEVRAARRCPTCRRPLPENGPCPRCSAQPAPDSEPIVFVSPRQDFHIPRNTPPEDLPDDNIPQATDDLPSYVLRQIALELKPEDRLIAAYILTNLDEDGLLEIPLVEVARYHHVTLAKVEEVLSMIQRADPVGVGSPSPQSALLVQLEVLEESRQVPDLTSQAIREGMDMLSRHQYAELGRSLGVSIHTAREIARFIGENLNPFPARAYWGDLRQGSGPPADVYTHPDAVISCLDPSPESPLVIEVVSPYAGQLQINPLFRKALDEAPSDKTEEWKSDLGHADLLVKCLQQRDHTMVRLMRILAILQRDFILNGDEHIKPITRASLAGQLDLHESTVSRAVSSKTVQLPSGHIIPLAKFFDRSLHVRTTLKQLIENETKPLSDNELVELLKEQGYTIARRTVAKYRSMEGILPSHLRQLNTPTETNEKEFSRNDPAIP